MIIAFDWETYLITPEDQTPPGVCTSFAEISTDAYGGLSLAGSALVTAPEGIDYLFDFLQNDVTIVGANTPFDVLVSIRTAYGREHEMKALWAKAYEEGRVRDVFGRQKLLDLAAGCYDFEHLPNGKCIRNGYSLADLTRRHTKRRLNKETPWRLRYGELDGVPIDQYPEEAYAYALEDAEATAEVFIAQERMRNLDPRIDENFPGLDPLEDEVRQAMGSLPLRSMSAYGFMADGPAVERLETEVTEKHREARTELVREGLVRPPVYARNTAKIAEYVRENGFSHLFGDDGTIKLSKKNYLQTTDPLLLALAEWKKTTTFVDGVPSQDLEDLVLAGLVDEKWTRDTKAAAVRLHAAYTELGHAVPHTTSYDPKPVEAGGKGHTEFDCISLNSDACDSSGDPMLELYSDYTSLAKTLSNDIPMLRSGIQFPIHTFFDELRETGRTSSRKPNIQNVRRLPGIRECFIPRQGMVFIDTDYRMLELHSLAQVCYWQFGYSLLGDALRAGQDPHLQMGARILGISYEEALILKSLYDKSVDDARTAGKGVNFGAPGGLGAKTFAVYSWTNYRIRITQERAKELIAIYKSTWREMVDYFKWINSLSDGDGGYNIVQPYSGRLRAGTTYCSACNSPFQGLGADVAKRALWLVWKACEGLSELGFSDPLYGCHPVNFVHDSIMTEVPEERAHECAMRQSELMDQAGREIMTDVPVSVDAVVTRRWSKKAKAWRDDNGRLIPWDLHEACRKSLDKWLEKNPEGLDTEAYSFLKKEEWPTDVAEEIVAQAWEEAA